ncbi:MAG: penicillin-binding protein activator [Rickettsiales bacterium]
MLKYLPFSLSLFLLVSCAPQKQQNIKTSDTPATSPKSLIADDQYGDPELGYIGDDIPTVKIALLVPLTGKSAAVGESMLDAATLAVYDSYLATPANNIKAKIVILPKDTGNSTSETINSANEAIEQGAKFIIGPLFSQSVTAIKPIAKEKNIPILSFSNNKSVASEDVYTFGFLPEQQIERIAEYSYLQGFQKVALLAPNNEYGEKVQEELSKIYSRKGGVVSPSELYAPSVANINAAISRIVGFYNNSPDERKFQAIFVANSGIHMRNIIKALQKNNVDLDKIKIIGAGIWYDKKLSKIPQMRGVWFPSPPEKPMEIFIKRFTTAYGYQPNHMSALSYDAVTLITSIAMSGKEIKKEYLTDKEGFNTPVGGLVRLLENGLSERKLAISKVQSDGFQIIDRPDISFKIK